MAHIFNQLDVYEDAGRKAAQALNEQDWLRCKFHSDWARKAMRLEDKEWATKARAAFDAAYKSTRKIGG